MAGDRRRHRPGRAHIMDNAGMDRVLVRHNDRNGADSIHHGSRPSQRRPAANAGKRKLTKPAYPGKVTARNERKRGNGPNTGNRLQGGAH